MRRWAYNSSDATAQRRRKKEQNNGSCDHVLGKARVCTRHATMPSQQMRRSWADWWRIISSLNNKTRTSRSLEGLPSRSRILSYYLFFEQQDCQQTLLSDAPKLLTVQRLWKIRKDTRGEHLLALLATCKNLRHRRENTTRPAVPAQHSKRRTRLVSRQ